MVALWQHVDEEAEIGDIGQQRNGYQSELAAHWDPPSWDGGGFQRCWAGLGVRIGSSPLEIHATFN
jgi:hypothetical protein